MPFSRHRRSAAFAIVFAFGIIAAALFAQHRDRSDAQVVQVALDPSDPARTRIGRLAYRGGLDIPRMGQNIGGLSALRWDAQRGRLLAIGDDARWVWITPVERDGQLTGVSAVNVGNLLGLEGEVLTGKQQGDSESVTRSPDGGWLIGFERDHRVWRYADLAQAPEPTDIDPQELLGELAENNGVEAMASSAGGLVLCAERQAKSTTPNCVRRSGAGGGVSQFFVTPSAVAAQLGGVPTDADMARDGTVFVLFRSYSPADGNTVSITAYRPNQTRLVLTTMRPPLTVDNFEGLAVREEATSDGQSRTFLYIISDDNFSSNQRTLLMKFEVVGASLE